MLTEGKGPPAKLMLKTRSLSIEHAHRVEVLPARQNDVVWWRWTAEMRPMDVRQLAGVASGLPGGVASGEGVGVTNGTAASLGALKSKAFVMS
jgi:hypothetical protein